MSRSNKLILLLVSAASAALMTPALAGPAPPPTPTATPTPTPLPGQCSTFWSLATVLTTGKGNSPTNNAKVIHAITGFIVDPGSLSADGARITVCRGTTVTSVVTDLTGGAATNSRNSTGILCNAGGCSVSNIQSKERYISRSEDGTDTDRITFIPK